MEIIEEDTQMFYYHEFELQAKIWNQFFNKPLVDGDAIDYESRQPSCYVKPRQYSESFIKRVNSRPDRFMKGYIPPVTDEEPMLLNASYISDDRDN